MPLKQALSSALLFWSIVSVAQQVPSHGTINLVLANGNGAVVISDSRLSNRGKYIRDSQKLFKLDDKTVAVIAGFYENPGPLTPANQQPFDVSIPFLMNMYGLGDVGAATHSGQSLDQKMADMVQIFTWYLPIASAAGLIQDRSSPDDSHLALIGYEQDRLYVISVVLRAEVVDRHVSYQPSRLRKTLVSSDLTTYTAGVTQIADSLLQYPEQASAKPVELYHSYSRAMKTNGKSLSIDALLELGSDLESKTSDAHSQIVGGPLQYAILQSGKVKVFVQPNLTDSVEFPFRTLSRSSGGSVQGFMQVPAIKYPQRGVVLIEDFTCKDSLVELDDAAVTHSRFDGCKLTYNGSSKSLFAPDNVLHNTTIQVSKPADLTSAFMVSVFANYPEMKSRTVVR